MTDPISNQVSRLNTSALAARTAADKADKADKKAGPGASAGTAKAARAVGADSLELSGVNQQVNNQPEFDRNKVEAIKQSIKDGTYPINPRRIAESFVALEKMIAG